MTSLPTGAKNKPRLPFWETFTRIGAPFKDPSQWLHLRVVMQRIWARRNKPSGTIGCQNIIERVRQTIGISIAIAGCELLSLPKQDVWYFWYDAVHLTAQHLPKVPGRRSRGYMLTRKAGELGKVRIAWLIPGGCMTTKQSVTYLLHFSKERFLSLLEGKRRE